MKYIIIIWTLFSLSAFAAQHDNKKVERIQSSDGRPCLFFTLVGVPEADPVRANSEWFSVAHDHPGLQTITSILFMAKATSSDVKVTTTGSLKCGHAEVNYVQAS